VYKVLPQLPQKYRSTSAPEFPFVAYNFGSPLVTFKFASGNIELAENGDPELYNYLALGFRYRNLLTMSTMTKEIILRVALYLELNFLAKTGSFVDHDDGMI